jgi:hypothetical protein
MLAGRAASLAGHGKGRAISKLTPSADGASSSAASAAEAPSRSRRIVLVAGLVWLATLGIGVAILWVGFATDFLKASAAANGATAPSSEVLVFQVIMIAFIAVIVGYATVGLLLAGRFGAGRIAALLLAGGALFALVPFGYVIGGSLTTGEPGSALFNAILLLGPVAFGPAFATILPGLAIAFPDGHLPSPRWRWPVGIPVGVVGVGTFLQIVRPGPTAGGFSAENRNPFGIEGLPTAIGDAAYGVVAVGLLGFTALGVAAVVVRYQRGTGVERQQQRWFLAAVSLAALLLALSLVPGIGGTEAFLGVAVGLLLVPISVGIAVTRYRLYEIDHLINRTLVYVPLTALLAGLYAATVALLQRVFQAVTGDRSDAAIIISTLILASVFTPIRKWLEGIVERRFKPPGKEGHTDDALDLVSETPEWEARVAAIARQVIRAELDARALNAPPPPPNG